MKDAFSTLKELGKGKVMDKLALAIHDATQAVQALNKGAEVTLTIKMRPLAQKGTIEAPLAFIGIVTTKLPEPDPEATVFYLDEDGQPTRNPTRQKDIPFTAATTEGKAA